MAQKEWKKIETASTWDFKEEKELIGIFKGVERDVGPNLSNLYSFKRADGSIIAVWGNTLLDNRFKNLKMGEEVKILYKGLVKSEKSGREYHDFEVWHREAEFEQVNEEIPVIEDEPLSEEPSF